MPPSDRAPEETVKAVLADELTARILGSRGGRRLLAMDDRAMREFLTSAASSLSVRPTDDPELKATIDAARAETRQRMDVVLSADLDHISGLAGALTALDEAGYAPRNCAGASGGAVMAALLAAGYLPNETVRMIGAIAVRPSGRRNLIPPRPGEIRTSQELLAWLADVLSARGVRTFGDLMLVRELRVSASLQSIADRLPGPVTTFALLGDLLPTHPSYGGGRAGKLGLEAPPGADVSRPVDDWFAAAWELFEADSSFLLDGRRLVCALAYLDGPTCEVLSRDGFLAEVEREIGTLDSELNAYGLHLRKACRGALSTPVDAPPAAGPGAAARESRLQVVVLQEQSDRVVVLPRD